jgi:hypothetical protein
MWTAADISLPLAGDASIAKFGEKSYPDRPLIVGFLDDLVNLDGIRAGKVDALATSAVNADLFIAMDQFAEFFARQTPINSEASSDAKGVYGVQFAGPVVITKDNLPPEGEHVPPINDYAKYFGAKWKVEFAS